MYIQVSQVVSNMIFSYDGCDFIPPVPTLQSIHWKGVWRAIHNQKNEGKYLLNTSAFSTLVVTSSLVSFMPRIQFLLPFFYNIPTEAFLIIPHIPYQI